MNLLERSPIRVISCDECKRQQISCHIISIGGKNLMHIYEIEGFEPEARIGGAGECSYYPKKNTPLKV